MSPEKKSFLAEATHPKIYVYLVDTQYSRTALVSKFSLQVYRKGFVRTLFCCLKLSDYQLFPYSFAGYWLVRLSLPIFAFIFPKLANNYRNKVVWITGASSGIGEHLAYEFARAGAKLVLSARNEQKLHQVRINSGLPESDCLIQILDITRSEYFEAAYDKVIAQFGQVDVLINNAGISQRAFARDTSIEVDRKIMETDYFGHIALTKLVLNQMRDRGWGQIGVTSSVVGEFGFPLRSAYSAAKHALHGFFETLKIEESNSGIQVNLIIPGRIRTDVSKNAIDGDGQQHGKMDPGQDGGMPVEKAAAKIFKKLKSNKYKIFIGNKELIMVYLKRWVPGLFRYLASRVSAS